MTVWSGRLAVHGLKGPGSRPASEFMPRGLSEVRWET
jgi:hypothetical protein